MSSNPFRKSTAAYAPVDAPPATPPPKRTKKKRVQIQTPPPLSPDITSSYGGRRLSTSDSATRAESPPPPPSTVDHRDDESDSTTTADSELEEAIRNTRRNSGSLQPPDAVPTSGMKAPYNPFARTLAGDGADTAGLRAGRGEGDHRAVVGRPALDVDAFKNILMTGSAVPSPPTGRANTTGPISRQHDSSSSNTDTSSIFDPSYSFHPESPRTSFDDYDEASESEDHEDERSNLRALGATKMDDMAPPAPPKPKSKGPQTVSFAEFNQSIPPDFQSTGPPPPPINHQLTSILRPSLSRSSSDLNKPLPPPPKSLVEPPPPVVPEKDLQSTRPDLPTIEDTKKAPPLPPARRKLAESTRPRSGSNLSTSTTTSDAPAPAVEQWPQPASVEDISNKPTPPPPPPARKTQSVPSATSSRGSSPNQSTTNVPKIVPPPPPRRQPSKLGRSENHTESAESTPPQQKPGDAFLSSLIPPNQNAPPAPPPRRVGGGSSKRSSMDSGPETLARRVSYDRQRRTSSNSFDSERSTSMSSLQQVPEPGEEPPQRDILADLSAFQAEIDALRQQTEQTR